MNDQLEKAIEWALRAVVLGILAGIVYMIVTIP